MTQYDPNDYGIATADGSPVEHRVKISHEWVEKTTTADCCGATVQIEYFAGSHIGWGANTNPCPQA